MGMNSKYIVPENKQTIIHVSHRRIGQSNRTRELIIKQPSKPEPRYIDNPADRHEIIMIGHVLTADHTPPDPTTPNFPTATFEENHYTERTLCHH